MSICPSNLLKIPIVFLHGGAPLEFMNDDASPTRIRSQDNFFAGSLRLAVGEKRLEWTSRGAAHACGGSMMHGRRILSIQIPVGLDRSVAFLGDCRGSAMRGIHP